MTFGGIRSGFDDPVVVHFVKSGPDFQGCLQLLAGTVIPGGLEADAQGAANIWAGTTGNELLAALNHKAGTKYQELNEVCNTLAGTKGEAAQGALQILTHSLGLWS